VAAPLAPPLGSALHICPPRRSLTTIIVLMVLLAHFDQILIISKSVLVVSSITPGFRR
jgi:hypothetical protein